LCITSPLAFRLVTDHPSDIPRTFFRFRL
jgi:hypothetical protein